MRFATSLLRPVPALCTVLLLTSCFEEPVAERVTLAFHPDGSYAVRVETAIADPGNDKNPTLAKRLAELRRSLEQGYDPWGRGFGLLAPEYERTTFERENNLLVRVERAGQGEDHDRLRQFLADAGVTAVLRVAGREMTLEIVPAGGVRASRSQRDRVHELLSTWSDAVARTYAATQALYAYLADHPERTEACLSAVFAEALSTVEQRPGRELSEADHAAVDPLREARKEVVEIFEVPSDEAYSLNELSHLVYDPFPARLAVEVPCEPTEVEGFERSPDGTLVVAGLGLYEAMQALGGVWAHPDPLVAYVEAARGNGTLSLAGLAGVPLAATSPSPAEVTDALTERLRAAPSYRVVFRLTAGEDEEPQADASAPATS